MNLETADVPEPPIIAPHHASLRPQRWSGYSLTQAVLERPPLQCGFMALALVGGQIM